MCGQSGFFRTLTLGRATFRSKMKNKLVFILHFTRFFVPSPHQNDYQLKKLKNGEQGICL